MSFQVTNYEVKPDNLAKIQGLIGKSLYPFLDLYCIEMTDKELTFATELNPVTLMFKDETLNKAL